MKTPDRAAMTAATPLDQHYEELRRQFSFSFYAASVPLLVVGLSLWLIDAFWPFGFADLVFGAIIFGIRAWVMRAPGTERFNTGCIVLGVLGLFIIGWHALFTGQARSFALWFLPTVAIITALLGTSRMSLGFALGGAGVALFILASEYVALVPNAFPVDPWLLTVCQLLLVGVTTTYSISARQTNDAHVRRLQDAYAAQLAQQAQLNRQAEALNRSLADAEQARRAADEASLRKSEFLAMMSHEIRTPLNGVVGLNSLLLAQPLDDKARQYAELARQSGEALLALINDFLDFSKIEAGKLALVHASFDPHRVVNEAVALLQEQARAKGLALQVRVEAPHALRGDAARLRQILLNLLGNAVKFTDRGSVTLTCRARETGGGQAWLHIEVLDTGIGISEATQQQLFQPFSQADASTTRRYGGTGLGLAICRALAQLMGGEIGVQSRLGEGSRFWLEIPFDATAEPPPATVPVSTVRATVPAPPRGSRGRVLVAEDNPVNQLVASEMLGRLGFAVDIAGDGRQAIEAALQHDYDLVLMDCDMPVIDGFAATRAIRARETGARVPVVAMTASALSGDRERCLDAGMDDYLAKPVRLEDVERLVRRWVRGGTL